jgi:hypothetical protein
MAKYSRQGQALVQAEMIEISTALSTRPLRLAAVPKTHSVWVTEFARTACLCQYLPRDFEY